MKPKRYNKKKCNNYIFQLSGSSRLYHKSQTFIDFTPINNIKQKSKNFHTINVCPQFNYDGKYYTPCFKLPCSKGDSDQQLLMQHKRKAYYYQNGTQELLIPKPRSKHKYCGVCRNFFEEYLDHIESDDHKWNLENSVFSHEIKELCLKFQKQTRNQVESFQQKSIQTRVRSRKQDLDFIKISSNAQGTQAEKCNKKEESPKYINLIDEDDL